MVNKTEKTARVMASSTQILPGNGIATLLKGTTSLGARYMYLISPT